MEIRLDGKVALVTGASRGIGRAIAAELAASGAHVMLSSRKQEALETAAAGMAGDVAVYAANAGDIEAADACVAATIERFGGLDILVNNAGVEITQLVVDLDPDDIRKMLEVNVLGTALGLKHAFRAMRPGGPAGRGGAVVNIASVAATIAFPGISVYSATKSAIDRLTRVAAMESGKLGYAVRVNSIYPGLCPTEMGNQLAQDVVALGLFPSVPDAIGAVVGLTPQGRLGEVADMADAVVFLASDASRFITGAGLPVDGGMGM